jgi:ABC-type nitrate/sulfonate/bicarbonate transport system substrate-binding protein
MSKKTATGVLCAAVITAVLVLAGCTGKKNQAGVGEDGRNAEGLFVVRVANPANTSETVIGEVLGFFRDEGIQIEFIGATPSGVSIFQLLDTNQIDFSANGHPPELAQARLRGAKIKAIAGGIVDHPVYSHIRYLTPENSSIKTLDDIVGKKIGIATQGVCHNGYLQYYLKTRGLGAESAEFLSLGQGGLVEQSAALGAVDLAVGHPPHAERVFAGGGVRQVGTSWDIFQSPGAGLAVRAVREDLIEEHPEVVQGLVNALYKARIWANTHQEETKELMAKWLGIDKDSQSVFWFDTNKNIERSHIEKWFEISETLDLWKPGEIQPTDIYTNKFVPKDINEDWAKL